MDRSELERLDFSGCASCISFNLRRATRSVTQLFDDFMRPSGLLSTQFTLLVGIVTHGSATINRLADSLGMDRTTMSRNLRPLEKMGLIDILAGKDRRTRVVIATDQGRETLHIAYPLWKQAQSQMIEVLGSDRSDRLLSDLAMAIHATQSQPA